MTVHAETTPAVIADRYLAAWNETAADRRQELMEALWTEDARYCDPLMRGDGRSAITALIDAVQARFPGHRFTLVGTPDGHGDRLRFSWSLAPEGGAPVARGTDFAELAADGRLRSVTGFLDAIAAAA